VNINTNNNNNNNNNSSSNDTKNTNNNNNNTNVCSQFEKRRENFRLLRFSFSLFFVFLFSILFLFCFRFVLFCFVFVFRFCVLIQTSQYTTWGPTERFASTINDPVGTFSATWGIFLLAFMVLLVVKLCLDRQDPEDQTFWFVFITIFFMGVAGLSWLPIVLFNFIIAYILCVIVTTLARAASRHEINRKSDHRNNKLKLFRRIITIVITHIFSLFTNMLRLLVNVALIRSSLGAFNIELLNLEDLKRAIVANLSSLAFLADFYIEVSRVVSFVDIREWFSFSSNCGGLIALINSLWFVATALFFFWVLEFEMVPYT